MTDPVDVATVLPKELRLGVPPKMPQARSYLFRQQSTLASYKPTETIQINIPRLQRSYLRKDSYLRFRVTGSFTQTKTIDSLVFDTAGAFGLFEKLEIFDYLGSTLLESISGIPQLSALLLDMGMKEIVENRNGNASMGLGTSYSYSGSGAWGKGTSNTPVATTTANIQNSGFILPPSSGDFIAVGKDATTGDVAGATVPFCREFAIPMPSFLGLLSEKMIPLHNGFTIILTVAGVKTPFFVSQPHDLSVNNLGAGAAANWTKATLPVVSSYDTAVNWRLEDVYLDCQILELGPVAESMILSSSQGSPLVVHTKAMRNYVANINTNTPEFTLNMNLNVASLSNIMWMMRSADHLESNVYASYGNRTRNFLNKWQFQYGSTTLPQSNGIEAMGSSIPSSVAALTPTNDQKYLFLSESGKETYQELMKSRPVSLTSSRITGTNFNRDSKFNFNLDAGSTPVVSATTFNFLGVFPSYNSEFTIGRFAAGLNLQLANGKDGQIICGLNTNGMNTSIRGVFHTLYLALMDKVRVDAWAEYDAFINISPGIATTVSF